MVICRVDLHPLKALVLTEVTVAGISSVSIELQLLNAEDPMLFNLFPKFTSVRETQALKLPVAMFAGLSLKVTFCNLVQPENAQS
jgi:hypothetical protein